MTPDVDLDASGLLDGLDGQARQDRAELLTWLLERGFTVEQIRGSVTPILLAANRIIGRRRDVRLVCRSSPSPPA